MEAANPILTGRTADRQVHRILLSIVRNPFSLLRDWNWKAAMVSALIRATMFLLINLRAGHHRAEKAMLVEAIYATVAAGLLGAITQRLRHAVPQAATALIIWAGLPALLLSAQYAVHRIMGTPRLRTSLIASFVFAAFATGFNWYAMQRGAMLTGTAANPNTNDLKQIPLVLLDFLLYLPKAALKTLHRQTTSQT